MNFPMFPMRPMLERVSARSWAVAAGLAPDASVGNIHLASVASTRRAHEEFANAAHNLACAGRW